MQVVRKLKLLQVFNLNQICSESLIKEPVFLDQIRTITLEFLLAVNFYIQSSLTIEE